MKPEGHLHNKEDIMNSRKHQMSLFIESQCKNYGEAPNLIEHVEFEGESHNSVRVAIPEQLPVKHIALLQKQGIPH